MPFIEAAFAHSAPQLSELERTMCFAHRQVSDLAQPHLSLQCVKHIVKFPDLAPRAEPRRIFWEIRKINFQLSEVSESSENSENAEVSEVSENSEVSEWLTTEN